MAFGTGHTSGLVGTAAPVVAGAALMAAETDPVVVLDPAARIILAE